ncbi:MAG: tryptophan--tRNA ligase [Bacilli bacterium]|nr:tryptophan--tRNA ligase [Bacilli bacterium]
MSQKVILTGDRPTGNLHIGHYFGAVKKRVEMQYDYNTYIIIADVQALTDNFENPDKVRKNVKELALDYLSVGIDPTHSHIFIQSMIPAIAELTVLYSNMVTVSRLYRNPTTKAELGQKKSVFGNDGESITYGFLGYPVSQAADLTAFDCEVCPVGDDQLPHLEQAREIVRKFNHIYGETLKEPEAVLSKTPRIKGLDGNEKMGKSLGNAIFLNDTTEVVSKKIMNALTDPSKIRKDDPANPEICMVYYYHKLLNNPNVENVCNECKKGLRGCVSCKKELIEKMEEFLTPIRNKRKYYEEHPEEVDTILKEGTERANKKAAEVLDRVKKSVKIDYFE